MKFKMAPNSLFAILLRSPWWVSFAIVAVFFLASNALLPKEYVVFGLMGAVPFFGIGVVRAWQQLDQPDTKRIDLALARAKNMSWRDFATVMRRAYTRQGYEVKPLEDLPVDFCLTKADTTLLVACKRWKAATHGADHLRDLMAVKRTMNAQQCLYVSLEPVSPAAAQFARDQGIVLVTGVTLAQLIVQDV